MIFSCARQQRHPVDSAETIRTEQTGVYKDLLLGVTGGLLETPYADTCGVSGPVRCDRWKPTQVGKNWWDENILWLLGRVYFILLCLICFSFFLDEWQ